MGLSIDLYKTLPPLYLSGRESSSASDFYIFKLSVYLMIFSFFKFFSWLLSLKTIPDFLDRPCMLMLLGEPLKDSGIVLLRCLFLDTIEAAILLFGDLPLIAMLLRAELGP